MKARALLFVAAALFSSSAEADIKKLRIGAALHLTGQLAFVGTAHQRGIQIAEDLQHREGTLKTEVTYEDTAGDPKQAVLAVQSLLRQNMDVIITDSTAVSIAVAPLVAEAKKILIYAASSRKIAAQNPMFFRDFFDAEDNGIEIARLLHARHRSQVAYLGEESDSCAIYQEAVRTQFGKDFVDEERYDPGEKGFGVLLLRLKAKHPDAIVMCTWRDTALVMKKLNELGMLGTQTFQYIAPFLPDSDTAEIRSLLEKNGALSTWYANSPEEENAMTGKFHQDFIKRFHEEPRGDSRYLFDDINFLADAARSVDESDLPGIAAYLKSHVFHGAAGTLRFDKDGVSKRTVTAEQVQKGQWVIVKE